MDKENLKEQLNKEKEELISSIGQHYAEAEKQYKREIVMLPQRESKVYISLTICMILVFFGFGFKPQWDNLTARREYNRELKTHRDALETRLDKIEELRVDLKTADPYLPALDKFMPIDSNMDDYLVEYVQTVSKANFILERLSQNNNSGDGTINVNTTLKGENDPQLVIELVKNIETLNRITNFQDFRIIFKGNESDANFKVNIYSLEAFEQ